MKSTYDSIDAVPEPLREHFELRDGKYVLKLDDMPPGFVRAADLVAANAKIVEFRDNNINLMKEVENLRPLKDRFAGLDPDEARKALEKVKALGKKGVDNPEDVDIRLRSMLEEAIKPLKEQIAQSAAETLAERRRADDFLLASKISETFTKMGGKPNAADFVVGLGKTEFEVKDNKVVAKTGKFSTERPGEPLTIDEWISSSIQKEHDYVFSPSNGGGAPIIKAGGSSRTTLKPGQTVLKDPTPQQLGEFSADIRAGKIKVEHSEQQNTH